MTRAKVCFGIIFLLNYQLTEDLITYLNVIYLLTSVCHLEMDSTPIFFGRGQTYCDFKLGKGISDIIRG